LYYQNKKKLSSLKHGVRAINHTSKTAQITFAMITNRTTGCPYKARSREPF